MSAVRVRDTVVPGTACHWQPECRTAAMCCQWCQCNPAVNFRLNSSKSRTASASGTLPVASPPSPSPPSPAPPTVVLRTWSRRWPAVLPPPPAASESRRASQAAALPVAVTRRTRTCDGPPHSEPGTTELASVVDSECPGHWQSGGADSEPELQVLVCVLTTRTFRFSSTSSIVAPATAPA